MKSGRYAAPLEAIPTSFILFNFLHSVNYMVHAWTYEVEAILTYGPEIIYGKGKKVEEGKVVPVLN
jgi:hypothetical protein